MKNRIFENANGKNYLIVKQQGLKALLIEINGYDVVVTNQLLEDQNCWNHGTYYFSIDEGFADFNNRIGG